jgi:hypothetical protein
MSDILHCRKRKKLYFLIIALYAKDSFITIRSYQVVHDLAFVFLLQKDVYKKRRKEF